MLCVPAVNALVVKLAIPPLRGTLPSTVAPSLNVTEPVGTPAADVSVTVNVTDCPAIEGFSELVTAVPVAARLMT